MKLCRFQTSNNEIHIGLLSDGTMIIDLTSAGVHQLSSLLEENYLAQKVRDYQQLGLPEFAIECIKLLAPIERQEVWAAGVTYHKSNSARITESDFGADAYNHAYNAVRPHLFFKSMPEKVVGPGVPVGIREDAVWSVPEPELAIVINSLGRIVGYTIANDLSSRDIEGENPLYLSQAKIYNSSCSMGPCIRIDVSEDDARQWTIRAKIERDGDNIYQEEISVSRIKRSFTELINYLFQSQVFPYGVVLLTGTGLVPDDDFTLLPKDLISINITGIGTLKNQAWIQVVSAT